MEQENKIRYKSSKSSEENKLGNLSIRKINGSYASNKSGHGNVSYVSNKSRYGKSSSASVGGSYNSNKSGYSKNLIFGEVTATRGATDARTFSAIYGVPTTRVQMIKKLYNEKKFKIWWYNIFFIAVLICLAIEPKSYLNCIEIVISMISIDLIGRAKVAGQVVAIVECFLYAYISFTNHLYGETIKAIFVSLPLVIFALLNWIKSIKRNSTKTRNITIRKLSVKGWLFAAVCFLGLAIVSYFLLGLLGTNALVLSAITFSISLLCKFLGALCYKENWIFAIIQASISFCLWTSTLISSIIDGAVNFVNLPIMFLYIAILTNAIYSLIIWRAMYRKAAVNGGALLGPRYIKIKRIIKLKQRFKRLKWDSSIVESKRKEAAARAAKNSDY